MTEKMSETSQSEATDVGMDPQTELHGLEKALTKFSDQFASSARRWELLIYPSMLIFSLLAASGFYLIFSLTQDMRILARHVEMQVARVQSSAGQRGLYAAHEIRVAELACG